VLSCCLARAAEGSATALGPYQRMTRMGKTRLVWSRWSTRPRACTCEDRRACWQKWWLRP